MKKSMIETAYDVMSHANSAMRFLDLWEIVAREMGFNQTQHDDNIAQFYSDLSMDGRFASLPNNTWDLRKRQSRAATIVDTDSLSVEDEEEEEDDYSLDEEGLEEEKNSSTDEDE
jgi:DNA-directed RNA polymerase subunit delta